VAAESRSVAIESRNLVVSQGIYPGSANAKVAFSRQKSPAGVMPAGRCGISPLGVDQPIGAALERVIDGQRFRIGERQVLHQNDA
jgi:hypothetical protein